MTNFDENNILDFLFQDEVDEVIDVAFPATNVRQKGAEVTVPFIKACLKNLGWTDSDLATYSSIHIDMIQAILQEKIRISDLDRDTLSEIANAIGYDISTFDLLVEYDNPTPEPVEIVDQLIRLGLGGEDSAEIGYKMDSKEEHLIDLQKDLLRLLMESLADYEGSDKHNQKLKQKYQTVIERVRSITQRYQAEVDEIREKIGSVRHEYKVEIESMKEIVEQLRKIQTLGSIVGLDEKPNKPAEVAIETRNADSKR